MSQARGDVGAEHNTCQACGEPIPSTGGSALVCGPGGGRLQLSAPKYCTDPACRAARDTEALERAIERGVITR